MIAEDLQQHETIFQIKNEYIIKESHMKMNGIWIKQIGAMVLLFNLDKVSLKKLVPTMNI